MNTALDWPRFCGSVIGRGSHDHVVAFSLSRLSDGDLSPLTMYTLRPMRPI
jgi:hypothetical protein